MDDILSNRCCFLMLEVSYIFNEINERKMVSKMYKKVMSCILSTKVKAILSGIFESTTYLFPTAANKPPILNPKRGST